MARASRKFSAADMRHSGPDTRYRPGCLTLDTRRPIFDTRYYDPGTGQTPDTTVTTATPHSSRIRHSMDWDPHFLARSPMFEPLRAGAPAFGTDWPALGDLQRLLEEGDTPVCNASGFPLRLVPPALRTKAPEDRYEARTFLRGELEVRGRNWHDLMNVLVWRTFPAAKAALNARHYAEERARRAPGNRGPVQDALTLFDEGGAIVVSDADHLLDLLRAFRWKELFWRRRDEVRRHMQFFVFGHAILEKALAPFTGITAGAILLAQPRREPHARAHDLLARLDSRLASRLRDPAAFSRTRDLAPVPVLGVPGWCADNEREEYYENREYFRPGRIQASNGT